MARDIKDFVKLQIGCGKQHFEDFINMDISSFCSPDIQHDIRKGFPMFEDNKFEHVVANGILEMIHPNEEFLLVLNELWRIIKSGGVLEGQVPSTDPRVFGLDPFDKRWFMEDTFNYWDFSKHAWEEFGSQYGFLGWHVIKNEINENGILCFRMIPDKVNGNPYGKK